MPSKIICPRCYFINDKDGYQCENCHEDISSVGITGLSSECLNHPFYKDGHFFDECPVKLEVIEEKEPESIQEEPRIRMVKICSVCGAKNSPDSPVCEKCNHHLMGTEPVIDQEDEKKEETPIQEEQPVKEEKIIHFNPQGYAFKLFNIELSGIDFTGGKKSYIGRDFQKTLDRNDEDFRYISRKHCYVRMDSRGIVYVGEEKDRPSSWGTAVFKPRTGMSYKVIPGPEGEIVVEQGDQIILACDYSHTAFPIIVLKK